MKQLFLSVKKGELKVQLENQDDLWYLSTVIEPNDTVEGRTIRKIKLGDDSDRNKKIIKKAVFISIAVEKIEFSKTAGALRVSGVITAGPDDIPRGEHHTFSLGPGSVIKITKPRWYGYQLSRIKDACKDSKTSVLLCVFDREEASFAILKKYGYELLSTLKGAVQKKADTEQIKGSFYSEIIKALQDYRQKYSLNQIILASPSFWKEELYKELKDAELKKIIIQATVSDVGRSGIDELLKRPETQHALKLERAAQESVLIEQLLSEIAKDNRAVYGIDETIAAINAGAAETLLLTDSLIQRKRNENDYSVLDRALKTAEQTKARVIIVSSEHSAGQKLEGLGGIGALLRYKL